jgi:hypothetical protein
MRYSEQANPWSPPDPPESPVRLVDTAHLPAFFPYRYGSWALSSSIRDAFHKKTRLAIRLLPAGRFNRRANTALSFQ